MGKAELRIEIDAALLERLRLAGIDVEALTVEALTAAVRQSADPQAEADAWAAENKGALEIMRERVARYGVFGEDLRSW